MTPRELFDLATAAINAADADALIACYAPDAVRVGYDGVLSGPALHDEIRRWLAARPQVRTLAFAAGDDTIVFEATDGSTRGYGTIVLRDGLIWRETVGTVAAEPAAAPRGVTVELEPYRAWDARPVADPRTAGADARMPILMEIVEAEGPVLARRAFGLYLRASGGKKLTTAVKAPLAGAAWRLKIQDRLAIGREDATTIDDDDVLRVAGGETVRVRELGPRTLDDVPLDEVAELMRRLREAGASDLKRAVLDTYGLIRLTGRADEYLGSAMELAGASAPPR